MNERSKILQRLASTAGCDCSPEMQQLRVAHQTCQELLREACEYLRDAAFNDAIVARWAQRAREATR